VDVRSVAMFRFLSAPKSAETRRTGFIVHEYRKPRSAENLTRVGQEK
jgi:hypothetical protein